MSDTSAVIAVISTLISSIALVGVMIGLLMQQRQLRISRLQAMRATHVELIRMGMDHPELWADPTDSLAPDTESVRRWGLLNWQIQHLKFGYTIGSTTEAEIRNQCSQLFKVASRREWWALTRNDYLIGATSRRARRFFAAVDDEHRCASLRSTNHAGNAPDA
jgi:hypothetical protein